MDSNRNVHCYGDNLAVSYKIKNYFLKSRGKKVKKSMGHVNSGNTLCGAVMLVTYHSFVQTHRMFKSEPCCKLWTLSDNVSL